MFNRYKNKVIIGSLTFTLVDKKLYICAYQGCVFLNSVLSLLKDIDISTSTYAITISAIKPILHSLSTQELVAKDGDDLLTIQLKGETV